MNRLIKRADSEHINPSPGVVLPLIRGAITDKLKEFDMLINGNNEENITADMHNQRIVYLEDYE
jgi:hypothetical protein